MLLCTVLLLHAVHISNCYLDLCYVNCTPQYIVFYLVVINWKYQEGYCSDVIRIVNKYCRNDFQNDFISAWYLKWGLSDFKAIMLAIGHHVLLF